MDPVTQLDELLPMLKQLVAGVDPAQLDAPTPCDNFALRGVLEHMITGATVFSPAFRGGAPGAPPAITDVLAQFPVAMDDLQDAIHSPGALETIIATPMGEVPGEVFMRFTVMDGLVHGYDISTASDQSYNPSPELVAEADGFTRQAITDDMRDGDTFAAATEPPAGASPLVSLVAFTGRKVA